MCLTHDIWISVALEHSPTISLHTQGVDTHSAWQDSPNRIFNTHSSYDRKLSTSFQLYNIFFSFILSVHVHLGLSCCKASCAFQLSCKQ